MPLLHNVVVTLFKDTYRIEPERLSRWNYRDPGAYFVTISTQEHKHLLGEIRDGEMHYSKCGEIAQLHLRFLAQHYHNISLDHFVVMPNHVHVIILIEGKHQFSPTSELHAAVATCPRDTISPASGSLGAVVRSYKSGVARECHLAGYEEFVWQSRYYDHIIRSDASLNAVRQYIEDNPRNWPHDPDRL